LINAVENKMNMDDNSTKWKQTSTGMLTNCHIGKCSGNFCFPHLTCWLIYCLLVSVMWSLAVKCIPPYFPPGPCFNIFAGNLAGL